MPLYSYKCTDHGVFDAFAAMKDYEKPCVCPQCLVVCPRVLSLPNTDMVENVRYSEAMGVHPSQVADGSANRMHPGATFDSQGRLRIANRKEKLQRIKERNRFMGTNIAELD